MAQRIAVWAGTDADLKALRKAVERNCECVLGETTCSAHEMLVEQDVLDHLAFVGSRREKYWFNEFLT